MKAKHRWGVLQILIVAFAVLTFRPGLVMAAPTQMSLSLTAGESYVINDVKPGDAPGVKVITNPHALVIHNEEPGKVVLLGAEAGQWDVTVNMASGEQVTYNITVSKLAPFADINNPATAPGPIVGSGKSTGSASPVVAKMDSGTGPVSSPAAVGASSEGSVANTSGSETVKLAAADAGAPAEPAATAPAPVSTRTFDFSPSPSGAAASQTAAAGIGTMENYRTDPSVTLSGGTLHSESVSGGTHYLPDDVVSLQTGSSRIIDFSTRLRRVSVADTTVADIQVINPFQVNLIGHKPGFTTLALWNNQGHYEERQVRIDPNGKQQVLLNTMVAELSRNVVENQGTNLSAALPNYNVSLVGLPGAVATPFSATAPSTSGGSTNATLPPGGTLIGMLLSQSLTYGLAAGNSNVQVQGLFQYLEQHNLAKILAQPHLLANSGEEAKFLSGGEIPIVVAQALNTSIVFKQFGTSVEFVPTVVGRNDIELLVKPEVSEPDFAHGVQLFGFTVPAFVTRRAETLVRLKDNQTLIIAGLILHEKKTEVDKVPYVGDIPYVGGLFRHTSYTNAETDLVMSVTPQIVRPLPDGGAVYNPTTVPEMTQQSTETRRLAQPDVTRPRF